MTARILVGTCSWADKTLVDSGWYPTAAKTPEDRLRFYAEQFPIVEVDATYYGLPSERNAALWVERTPDDFVFDVKSYALFTQHPAALRSLPKDLREALPSALQEKRNLYYRDAPPDLRDELWARFNSALLPLDSAGKLGTVLFQFPPWFHPGGDSSDYILEAKERLGQYTIAVEFRNDRWLSERNQERTLQLLALQTPVASDLRLLSAMLHIDLHLERIGDQAVNIGKIYLSVRELPASRSVLGKIQEMCDIVSPMIRTAMEAFRLRDLDLCLKLPRMDDPVDRLNMGMYQEVSALADDPGMLDWGLRMLVVARQLERVGDNAVDIAEQVGFLLTGEFREFTDASHPVNVELE